MTHCFLGNSKQKTKGKVVWIGWHVTCAQCNIAEISGKGKRPVIKIKKAGWTAKMGNGTYTFRCLECSKKSAWCSGHQKFEPSHLFDKSSKRSGFQRYCKKYKNKQRLKIKSA